MNAKKYPLVYLLLALAVFASSVAWAPPAPTAQKDPDDPEQEFQVKWHRKYRRGQLGARIIGDEVWLRSTDLPNNHSFFFKVRRGGRAAWERLGVAYSDSDGTLEDSFRLPQRMRKAMAVQVCLKDISTNRAYCMFAWR